MLSFERRVVTSMIGTDDPQIRSEVVSFVDGALAAMPEFLRLGITSISIGAGTLDAARRLVGNRRSDDATLAWLEAHPIGLVRQWVRALRSLVLFAENEKLEAAAVPAR
jgi:hypothetical protein